jgi:hypothetical protein
MEEQGTTQGPKGQAMIYKALHRNILSIPMI